MRQRPRPMKLDETHKKKKQQTVNAPPCRQHGWHGRQKNGLRKNGWRRRNKQRLGRRKKLSCRECSQPADAAPRQAKRKSQAEKNKARNKRRRELRQEARQSQDPEARGKIGRARDARRVADANARSGSHAWPPWRKTGKGKPRAQLRPQEKKKESKERKKEKERRKERKKEKERERKKERKKERKNERKKDRTKERTKERKKEKKERKERKKKERTQRKHEKRRIWRELDASLRRTRVKKLEKTNTLSQRQRPPVTPCLRADWSCSGRCQPHRRGGYPRSSPQSDRLQPDRRRKRKAPKNKKRGQIADTEASRDG